MSAQPGFNGRSLVLPDATLRYDLREQGVRGPRVPGLVFLPGLGCPRESWGVVASALDGYSALLVDPPGQGDSTTTRPRWSIEEFGKAIGELVRSVGWKDVILVGHSLGGAMALEAAIDLGPTVRQVIGIDALMYDSRLSNADDEVIEAFIAPFEADYHAAMRMFVTSQCVDTTDVELVEQITRDMSSMPAPAALAAMRAMFTWDRNTAIARCPAPIDILAAAALLNPDVINELKDELTVIPVDLGGHFFYMEDPAATGAAIAQRIESLNNVSSAKTE